MNELFFKIAMSNNYYYDNALLRVFEVLYREMIMVLLQSAFDNHAIEQIANDLRSLFLTQRQLYDLELILNGGFSPLTGFLDQKDYHSVLQNKRLADGSLWPIPINLDIDHSEAEHIEIDDHIALRDKEGLLIAILKVNDKWVIDKKYEAEALFGINDQAHPGVFYLFNKVKSVYLGGRVIRMAAYHYDFQHLCFTPAELRELFKKLSWKKMIAVPASYLTYQESILLAAKKIDAHILIHPIINMTKAKRPENIAKIRYYEQTTKTFPANRAVLSLLPLAIREAGALEVLWHAIIHKNFGCTHLMTHDKSENLLLKYQFEIGIQMLFCEEAAEVV